MSRNLIIPSLLVLAVAHYPAHAAVINVPADQPTIQAAINAAVSGVDEVVVAPGIYVETINFNGKAITVRSSGGREVTTLDGNAMGSVVTCESGEGSSTVLDGFTITGGTGTSSPSGVRFGGGMFVITSSPSVPSSPTVRNCNFNDNTAQTGAGFYSQCAAGPSIENCYFEDNAAVYYGGGVASLSPNTSVTDCVFINNSAPNNGGGGIYFEGGASVTDCVFRENTAYNGGGMYNRFTSSVVTGCDFFDNTASGQYGGGLFNHGSSPTVTNCRFIGNAADEGGGGLSNDYSSSPTAINCIFSGNSAFNGGAVGNNHSSDPTLINCSFSRNTAPNGGAFGSALSSNPTLRNCILWGDTLPEIVDIFLGGAPVISYSTVQGGLPPGAVNGGHNSYSAPMWVDADGPDNTPGTEDDNLRLLAGSPCIDAGLNSAIPGGVTTDLDGEPRISGGVVDMGAYEFRFADCNGNDTPDDQDLAGGTSVDCNANTVPDECDADCNLNGIPDDCDLVGGTSEDCNINTLPDECETDCNANGIPDDCDIDSGMSGDDDGDGLLNECEANITLLGAIGDSLTDEYTDSTYGTYADSWTELLVFHRSINMGPTAAAAGQPGGTWGEPRRTGYQHNWARSGATTDDMIATGQHTGLADSVSIHGVSHATMFIGVNDCSPWAGAYEAIYNGTWSQAQIDGWVAGYVANVTTALNEILPTGVKLVLINVPDLGIMPFVWTYYPDGSRRSAVAAAIEQLNGELHEIAVANNLALVDMFALNEAIFGPGHSYLTLSVGNVDIDLRASNPVPQSAFVNDGIHPHTVLQSVWANVILTALNEAYDAQAPLFSEEEMLANASLTYGGSDTLHAQIGDYVGYVTVFGECPRDGSGGACPQCDLNESGLTEGLDIAIITSSANFGLSVDAAAEPCADVNGSGIVEGLDVAACTSSACFGL